MAVVAVRVPDLPVTVRVALPRAAVAPAARVRVPAPLALSAPNVPVTPLGSPDTLRATVPEKPPTAVTCTVAVVLEPVCTDTAPGVAESVNDGVVAVGLRTSSRG